MPPDVRAALAPFVPDFHFVVDDLTQVPASELRGRAATSLARLSLLCLQRIRAAEDPCLEVERLHDLLREVRAAHDGHDAVLAVIRYVCAVADTSRERMHDALRLAGPDTQAIMTTLEERLLAKGEARGEARGEAKGRMQTLRALLEVRSGTLPAEVIARLTQATATDLDRWTPLVLTAPTLNGVFA